jgi:hypothetical protein
MWKVLLILGILLAVIVGGVATCVVGIVQAGKALVAEAEPILRDASEGRAGEVWDAASPGFRSAVTREEFVRMAEGLRRVLGTFRRIAATTSTNLTTSTGSGTVGRIAVRLDYEKASTRGEVAFVKIGDAWRLEALQVDVPPTDPDRSLLEPLARELLDLLGESRFVALYQRFAPGLQQNWPPDRFEADMRRFLEEVGPLREVAFRTLEDEPDGSVTAVLDASFARARAVGRLRAHWRANQWEVFGFSVRPP